MTPDITTLDRKVDRILNILENDSRTNQKGLVTQVAELKNNFYGFRNQYNTDVAVKKTKDTIWKVIWGAVGAIAIEVCVLVTNWILR